MAASPESLRDAWTRHAAAVARKVNLAWWLQLLSTPLVAVGLAGAFALLLLRRELPETSAWTLGLSAAGLVVLLGGIAWLIARRRFERPEQSLVRIEATMRLHSALSAARAGVAPWPELPPQVDAGLQWNWQRVVVPPLAALAFLAAGLFLPVSARTPDADARPDQPLAWEDLAADLERLEQDEVIDETYIEEMRKKLEELKSQDEEEWFSHSSLEATDSLKKEHHTQIDKFGRELDRAEKALEQLQKNSAGMSAAEKDRQLHQFDQALQGLQNGALKPNPQLLDQLKQLDPKNLGQIPPEQLQQLRDAMKKAGQSAKGSGGPGQGEEWLDELLDGQDGQGRQPGQGNGKGQGNGEGEGDDGQPGDGTGSGGVQRGPGHSPGMLGDEGRKIDIGELTGLESKDLSRSLPGDLLQLQDGEHDVDQTSVGPRSGGAASATGDGGDRVWRDSLDPAEQRTLKKFFE